MKHSITAAAALLLAACGGGGSDGEQPANGEAPAPAAATGGDGAAMQPGLWETTVQVAAMNIPNMPKGMAAPVPTTTARYCLTPEQAARPNADFFGGGGQNAGCTYEDFSMTGGRIQGTMTCNLQGTQTRTTMDGRFGSTSYEMNQRSQINLGGTTTESEVRITGRRVGDCP